MTKYTCAICKEEYPFDYMKLVDNHLVCSQCLLDELWKKHTDPRKPVLDLIDRLQDEVRRAAGNDFYDNIYCAMEVRDILNEIQQAIYDMEV